MIAFPSELRSLLAALRLSEGAGDLAWLGAYLARLVGRREPWSRTHLLGILRGYEGVSGGLELRAAVRSALAIIEEDVHPVQATHSEQLLLVAPGIDAKYAQIGVAPRSCVTPGCPIRFVPNHPRRSHCYLCSPAKSQEA
jgi:hypothetical protein